MPFMRFLYFLLRLSILLILTILPYLSLCTGHMVRFNAVYAPHVPQSGHITRLKGGANIQRRDTGVTKGVAAQRGIGAGIDSWWLRRGVVGNVPCRESARNGHSRR